MGDWNQREKSRRTCFAANGPTRATPIFATRPAITATADQRTTRPSGRHLGLLFEVEDALVAHPAVLEAAIVGHADEDGLIKPESLRRAAGARRRPGSGCTRRRIEGACEGSASGCGNIRAGWNSCLTSRRPRRERSSATSFANWNHDKPFRRRRRSKYAAQSPNSRCTNRRASTPATRRR